MTLLIDDKRDLPADIIARNYWAGDWLLHEMGKLDCLKLDHDLGEEKTGYDIVLTLEQWFYDESAERLPTRIELVTDNPVGLKNMVLALERMYPYQKGRVFSMEPL